MDPEDFYKSVKTAIDHEIIHDFLVADNWIRVIVNDPNIDEDWCNENFEDQYRCFGYYWYFKSQRDATLFELTWAHV